MANITGSASEKVFQIQRWLGLNENPDGDTKLKMGEGAVMRNFRVTRDGNLQKRPGTRHVLTIVDDEEVEAVWTGFVAGKERVMAICNNELWSLWNETETEGEYGWSAVDIGPLGTTNRPHMFGFADKLYILTGSKYMSWEGDPEGAPAEVDGYVPVVAVAVPPAGGGELYEQVNKLSTHRKIHVSPDGTAVTFTLPEEAKTIEAVKNLVDDSTIVGYTLDTSGKTVTFDDVNDLPEGPSTVEIEYVVEDSYRSEVEGMHFSETFNGSQDTRVFLYGDGSNVAIYSDIDGNGQQSAEYFPDQNVVRVGEENTPITSLIRHYSALIAFKSNSTYSIQYGNITLATGDIIPAFYVTPINRSIGCEAEGQAQLVLNNAVTLFGQDCYEWRNTSRYGTVLTRDERQAKRISDRVYATLHGFDTKSCITFDDNYHQEYYVCSPDGNALVYGYAADAWYVYTQFPMHRPFSFHNELYYGSTDGRIVKVSTAYSYDMPKEAVAPATTPVAHPIDCYWESGSMAFGVDYQRKNSAMLWIGIKPDASASIDVTVLTDKDATYVTKNVSYEMFDFEHIDFENINFNTNDKPQMRRLKIKAKKFVFYKLVMKTDTNNTSVTVTSADIRVRFMGYHK